MFKRADYYTRKKLFNELVMVTNQIKQLKKYFQNIKSEVDRNDLSLSVDEMQYLIGELPEIRKRLAPMSKEIQSGDFKKEYLDKSDVLETYESMMSAQEKDEYGKLKNWNEANPDKKRYLFFVTVKAPGKSYGTAKKFWIEAPNFDEAKKRLNNRLTSQKLQLIRIKNEDLLNALEQGWSEEDKKKQYEDKLLQKKLKEEEKKQKEEDRKKKKVLPVEEGEDVYIDPEDLETMPEEDLSKEEKDQRRQLQLKDPLNKSKEDISEIVKNILHQDINRGK